MGFIDPCTDFGFKRVFGSPRSTSILRSFLNAIVYQGEPRIETLEIVDPFQQPSLPDFKLTILDVKAQLDDGSIVIVEMQVAKVPAFLKRILYNTTKAYSGQLKRGRYYLDLKPVISVTITDFVLFENGDRPISRFKILNEETHEVCTEEFRWIFVELPKFEKELSELSDLADRWMYFLRRAEDLTQIPSELNADEDLNDAFEIASESQLSSEELALIEAERDRRWLQAGAIASAREDALEEGDRRARLEIARGLLESNISEVVSQMTGLPVEEIRGLAEET